MTSYQERYLAHQARKKAQLEGTETFEPKMHEPKTVAGVLNTRRSQRVFTNDPVNERVIDTILEAATVAPSSCNRHGIKIKVVKDRYEKNVLSGLMVGATGWAHRAGVLFLYLADPVAYASPNEKEFMHYCDVGFTAMSMWLIAEQFGLGAAYINPNLADNDLFRAKYGDFICCGVLAVGNYEGRVPASERPTIEEITC